MSAQNVWSRTLASATAAFSLMVGLGRVELPTSPLSGVRSNQLSYRPVQFRNFSSPLSIRMSAGLIEIQSLKTK